MVEGGQNNVGPITFFDKNPTKIDKENLCKKSNTCIKRKN